MSPFSAKTYSGLVGLFGLQFERKYLDQSNVLSFNGLLCLCLLWVSLAASPGGAFGSAVISVCQHAAAVSMPSRAGGVVVW